MPMLDVLSFRCRDESEFGSDEVYVRGSTITGARSESPVYGGLDTNDTINPEFAALSFPRNGWADLALWEDDGAGRDTQLGYIVIEYTPEHIGTHTVTMAMNGGEYDLTYRVW